MPKKRRYIDANKLEEELRFAGYGFREKLIDMLIRYERNIPTADVRENIRAHFIGEEIQCAISPITMRQCSNCKAYVPITLYCCGCGARLEVIDEDD